MGERSPRFSALDVEICYYVVTILSAICSSLGDNIVCTRWIKVIDVVPRFLRFVVIKGLGKMSASLSSCLYKNYIRKNFSLCLCLSSVFFLFTNSSSDLKKIFFVACAANLFSITHLCVIYLSIVVVHLTCMEHNLCTQCER